MFSFFKDFFKDMMLFQGLFQGLCEPCYRAGQSLRARHWGFPLATMSMTTAYFLVNVLKAVLSIQRFFSQTEYRPVKAKNSLLITHAGMRI